jgi:hypothetical protein
MNSPRKLTRSGTRGYAHLVEVSVPVARVWRALTDPALVRIWSGQEAEIDPREGGLYRIGRRNGGGREAHIDVASDSAVVDDFLLDVRKSEGMTSLRLLGSGISEAAAWDSSYVKMRLGWERFLSRIKVTLESPPKPRAAKAPEPPKDPPLPGLDY